MYIYIYVYIYIHHSIYNIQFVFAPPIPVGFASVVPPGQARDAWQRPGRCGVHSRSDHGIDGVVANVRPRSGKQRMNF